MNSKKLIYTLLISVFFFSCDTNDSEKMTSEDLKDISADCDCAQIDFKRNAFGNKIKGSLMYDINTKEVFSGTCEEKFGDGSRKEMRQYANGKLHGNLANWDENGALRRHLSFSNGEQDGDQFSWYSDEKLKEHSKFKNGIKTGEQLSWHKNGQKNSLLNFNNGTKHGIEKTWDDQGKLIFESERKNGNFINSGFEYEESGMVKSSWKNIEYSQRNNKNMNSIQIENNSSSGEYNLKINDKLTDDQIIEFIKEDVIKKHFNNDPTKFVISTDGGWYEPHIFLGSEVYGKGYEKNKERFRIAKLLMENIKGIQIPFFAKEKNVDYYKVKNGCENIRVLVKAIDGNNYLNRYRDVCDFEWFQVDSIIENQAEIILSGNMKGFILVSQIERISGDNTIEVEKKEHTKNIENNMDLFKISDPDGYSNLRKTPGGEVIKKVYEDERFEVLGEKDKHREVKLEDGTTGYIHESRVTQVN